MVPRKGDPAMNISDVVSPTPPSVTEITFIDRLETLRNLDWTKIFIIGFGGLAR